MSQCDGNEARAAASEARECCERIVAALEVSIRRAKTLGDVDMVNRLMLAKARADRAGELVESLGCLLDGQQADEVESRK